MRSIILGTVLAIAGLAHSQNGLPSCAQDCVKQFTQGSQIGSCGNLDIQCICSNQSFLGSIACCLAGACNASDQALAVTYAKQICTTAGVTVPDAVVCASSSATSPATSAASSAVAPASSSAGSSTGATVASISATPVSATSSSTPASSAVSAASSAQASASPTKNAGIQNAAGASMSFVGGGLAAIFALL